jgi:adenylosuccinate lyase
VTEDGIVSKNIEMEGGWFLTSESTLHLSKLDPADKTDVWKNIRTMNNCVFEDDVQVEFVDPGDNLKESADDIIDKHYADKVEKMKTVFAELEAAKKKACETVNQKLLDDIREDKKKVKVFWIFLEILVQNLWE